MGNNQLVRHEHANTQPIKVTITRGQKDTYGWEISVQSDTYPETLYKIEEIDNDLRRRFKQNHL